MTTKSKTGVTALVIVIVIIIIGLVWYMRSPGNNTDLTSSTVTGDLSDQAIDRDMASVDGEMNGLDQDSRDMDSFTL